MEQAERAQKAFEQKYAKNDGVLGIGVGLNAARNDLAINVFVSTDKDGSKLPSTFDGLDVVVDVAGEFRAF